MLPSSHIISTYDHFKKVMPVTMLHPSTGEEEILLTLLGSSDWPKN